MPAAARARLASFACALVAALVACAITDEPTPDARRAVIDGDRITLVTGQTAHLVAHDLSGDIVVDVPAGADDVVFADAVDGPSVALRGGVPALTLVELRDADGRVVELTVHVLPLPHVQHDDARTLALSR